MKKRFSKLICILLTLAVTATTISTVDGFTVTAFAKENATIEAEAKETAIAKATADESTMAEVTAAEAELVNDYASDESLGGAASVVEDAIIDEASVDESSIDEASVTAPGLYIAPDADLVAPEGVFEFNVYAVYTASMTSLNLDYALSGSVTDLGEATSDEMKDANINASTCHKLKVEGTIGYTGNIEVKANLDGEAKILEVYLVVNNPNASTITNPNNNNEENDYGIIVSFEDCDVFGTYDREMTARRQGEYFYTGYPITPNLVVRDGNGDAYLSIDNELVPGKDYTVKYKNNKNLAVGAIKSVGNTDWDETVSGIARDKAPYVEITLKGSYAGPAGEKYTIRKYFDIVPAIFDVYDSEEKVKSRVGLKNDRVEQGKAVEPVVTIYSGIKKGVHGDKKTVLKKGDFDTFLVKKADYVPAEWSVNPSLKFNEKKIPLEQFNTKEHPAQPGEYFVIISSNKYVCYDKLGKPGYIDTLDGASIHGQAMVTVYDKEYNPTNAKVTLSKATISYNENIWNDQHYGEPEQLVDVKGYGFVTSLEFGPANAKQTLTEADFSAIELYRKLGKQTKIKFTPSASGISKGFVAPTWVNVDVMVTGKNISNAAGVEFYPYLSITRDADAKIPTYVMPYNYSYSSVNKHAFEAGLGNGSAKIILNGEDIYIGSTSTYEVRAVPKKSNSDPVGDLDITLVGNKNFGYTGSYKMIFRVVPPANASASNYFDIDENPKSGSEDFWGNTFSNNEYRIPATTNTLSFNKKMKPEIRLLIKNNINPVPLKNNLYQVKYTLPKGAGEGKAEFKFKGCLKNLKPATVYFTVNKTSLKDCNYNDPSFVSTKEMTAGAIRKKVKLVITDDVSQKNKLKEGKDYLVSSNIYTLSTGNVDDMVAADANETLSMNGLYYMAVTANPDSEGYNMNLADHAGKPELGILCSTDGSVLYIPFTYGLTFSKNTISDQTIYQKNDISYFDDLFAEYKVGDVTLKRGEDYTVVYCNKPSEEYYEYYGSAGTKKVKLVALQKSRKVSGSIVLTYNVKVRNTDNSKYRKVLEN